MTVLSVAYPLFPVHEDAAGGAEQILYLLDRQFCASGICSIVIAAGGSRVHGELVQTCGANGRIDQPREQAQAEHAVTIARLLQERQVDLLHLHGLDFHTYLPKTEVPILATLHLPLEWYAPSVLQAHAIAKTFSLNCVSKSQSGETRLPVVTNGIDTRRYRPAASKGEYLLWLGRICPEKGVHLALEAAKAVSAPLLVAGPVHPFTTHQEYFRSEIEPLLNDERRYIGPVSGSRKRQLLAEARALLVTSTVAETSSLVAMEAASSGTPVVAINSGALSEVVHHGVTGWVVSSSGDLPGAIEQSSQISPLACRQHALAHFDADRMAADYLSLYSRILGTNCAPQEALYVS